MKARFSENYYKDNWDRFIKETRDADYINLEDKLQYRMKTYAGLPQEAVEKIEKVEAQRLADEFTVELKVRMKMVNDLESGKSSLGYINQMQEVQAKDRIISRFEFNCYQLSVFKKAHLA